MSEYFGGDCLYTMLSADTGVTALVGSDIYRATVLPTSSGLSSINFYPTTLIYPLIEYFDSRWSVDCRASKQDDSIAIAEAVKECLNRHSATVGGYVYFITCTAAYGPIPPADDTDVYNTSLSVQIRRK